MDNIRVCVFCESWESGGIESFVFNVLSNMSLENFVIDIVVSQLKNSIFSQCLKDMGVNFIGLSGSQKRLFKNSRMFKKLLRERKYDVIHMNIFHAISFIYAVSAKKCGIKTLIAHSHNTKFGSCRSYPLKILLHSFFKSRFYTVFTDYWACSEAAAAFLFPDKIINDNKWVLVPDGIDTRRFLFKNDIRETIRNKLNIGDKPLLVNVGRLCEQKNQMFLLDMMKKLAEHEYDCILLLIGEGEMLSELKKRADTLEIADSIIFYGTVPNVENMLCAGDIFVFPSIFEGFGMAALEAQAAGLPVICSEYVPKETYVTENIRTVALKGGAEKWAEAVIDILSKPQDRAERSKAAEEIRKKGFDIRETAERIEKYYRCCKGEKLSELRKANVKRNTTK